MHPFRAILLDLDGTLLDREGAISPRNHAAVRAAVAGGLEVYLATGRSVRATLGTHRALELTTPACCYNGAVMYCGQTDRWLSHLRLDDGLCREVVEFCLERELFFVAFHEDRKHAVEPLRPEHGELLRLYEHVEVVARDRVPVRGATKVSFGGGPLDLEAFDRRFAGRSFYQERFPVRIIPGFDGCSSVICDLLSGSCRGKAEALHYLEAERGIPREAVIAVGDHTNDLSMIRRAGLGVAMGNAPEEIKREAKLVIGRHDEDGVGGFLEAVLAGLGRASLDRCGE